MRRLPRDPSCRELLFEGLPAAPQRLPHHRERQCNREFHDARISPTHVPRDHMTLHVQLTG